MMSEAHGHEILSALIDREPVDPDRLARVLEDADARAMLVDFVRLRAALDHGEPSAAASPTARTLMGLRGGVGTWWLGSAAALVLLAAGVGGGVWLGERLTEERPPLPSRVVQFVPGVDWNPSQGGGHGGL